jgi:hypothetical protein
MKQVDVVIGGQYVSLSLENRTNRTNAVYIDGKATAQVTCFCGAEHGMSEGQTVRCSFSGTPVAYTLERKTDGVESTQKYFVRGFVAYQNEPKQERRQRPTLWKKKPTVRFTLRDLEEALSLE